MNNSKFVHEIPTLKVLVDGFRHSYEGCSAYFLTHFHGDHYSGLKSDFNAGIIYCTEITGALVTNIIGVDERYIQMVKIGETIKVEHAHVTFLDANHCPGAALLLFELNAGKWKQENSTKTQSDVRVFLHTGDMRYHPRMKSYDVFQRTKIDTVYLDTTYCHPKHTFACQVDTIQEIATAILTRLKEDELAGQGRKTVFLLSAYNIGKEKILVEVARQTGHKIWVDERKIKILQCLGLSEAEYGLFTNHKASTPLHVCRMGFCGDTFPYFQPNFKNLQRYLATMEPYTHVYAFIPTGWASSSNYNKRNSFKEKENMAVKLVPYSEHSNYDELLEFVQFLKPRQVIPTVFSDKRSYDQMVKRFHSLVDHTENVRAFLQKIKKTESRQVDSAPNPNDNYNVNYISTTCGMETTQKDCIALSNLDITIQEGNSVTNSNSKSAFSSNSCLNFKNKNAIEPVKDERILDCIDKTKCLIKKIRKNESVTGSNKAADLSEIASWACLTCTFVHNTPENCSYLACSICGSERRNEQQDNTQNKSFSPEKNKEGSKRTYDNKDIAPISTFDEKKKKQAKLKHFFS